MKTKRSDYYELEIAAPLSGLEEQLYLRDLKQRKLFLNTEICLDSTGDIARHILQINAEDRNIPREKRRPILLYICSPGGDVDSGFGLIDAIEASETPVYTINMGFEYSMAFLIGLSGHKRFAMRNAKFLMHDGSSFAYNSTSKLQDQMEFQKAAEHRIMEYVISHSSLSEEEYREKWRVEWYMFADEAKEHGFCDCIIGEDCALDEVV